MPSWKKELEVEREARKALEAEFSALKVSGEQAAATSSASANRPRDSVDQRATAGALDSYKANVSALDTFVRTLDTRVKKLEMASTTVESGSGSGPAPAPVGEIGTPPPQQIGKRHRDGDLKNAGDSSEFIPPSMEPSPAKRARLDEDESVDISRDAPSLNLAPPTPAAAPSLQSKLKGLAPKSPAPATPATSSPSAINPSEATKPSTVSSTPLSRPRAPIPRRSSSSASTSAKMIRTSAVSFGQGLVPTTPGAAEFGFGFTPFGSSTPASGAPGSGSNQMGDVSIDTSITQFRPPSFSFGGSFAPPKTSPKPFAPQIADASSPAFPIDAARRPSNDYEDDVFGGRPSSGTVDSPPPPSPSKRTMYGTELATPLRQELAAERRARYNPSTKAPTALNAAHIPQLREEDEDVEMASASMLVDDTGTTSFLESAKGSGFPSGPASGATTPPPPTAQNANTSPSRYGLDNPLSWGGAARR